MYYVSVRYKASEKDAFLGKGDIMKIKALIDYFDTFEKKDVKAGEVYETTDERAQLIITNKYAEEAKEEKKSARKAKSKKAEDPADKGSGLQSEEEAES